LKSAFSISNITAEPGQKAKGWLHAADLPGSSINLPVMITNGVHDGPCLLLVSGIHGAEYNPIESNIRFQKSLKAEELHGAVISCIVTNIGAFNTRTTFINPIDGKDISSSFPGKENGTISEKVAWVVHNELIEKCDYMIDMHGGDFIEDLRPMTIQLVTGEKELDEKIAQMARCFGGEYNLLRFKDRLGSSPAGTAALVGKPSFIVESGRVGTINESDVKFYLDGLTNLLKLLEMIPGKPTLHDHRTLPKARLIMLKRGGIWHPIKLVGSLFEQDELLGTVTDVFGEIVEEVRAPMRGVVLFHVTAPAQKAGDAPMWLGEFE